MSFHGSLQVSFLLWLTTALLPLSVEATNYRIYCDLRKTPITTLELQDGVYQYTPANTTLNATSSIVLGGEEYDDGYSLVEPAKGTLNKTIQVRRCTCYNSIRFSLPNDFFCPLETTHCGVAWGSGLGGRGERPPPGCLNLKTDSILAENLWPIACSLFVFLFFFLLWAGPDVFGYVRSAFDKHWNPDHVDDLITQRPRHANALLLRYMNRESTAPSSLPRRRSIWRCCQRRRDEEELEEDLEAHDLVLLIPIREPPTRRRNRRNDDGRPKPISLKLKTRIFRPEDALLEDPAEPPPLPIPERKVPGNTSVRTATEEDFSTRSGNMLDDGSVHSCGFASSCTICYGSIRPGERVGALPECDHSFHVACLKVWLRRRNVCPLCLSENVATPQYANGANDNDGDDDIQITNSESTDEESGENRGNSDEGNNSQEAAYDA